MSGDKLRVLKSMLVRTAMANDIDAENKMITGRIIEDIMYDYAEENYVYCRKCGFKTIKMAMPKLKKSLLNSYGYIVYENGQVLETRCPICTEDTLVLKREKVRV